MPLFIDFLRLLALHRKSDGLELSSILEEEYNLLDFYRGTLHFGIVLCLENVFRHGDITSHPNVVHFAVISQWETKQ